MSLLREHRYTSEDYWNLPEGHQAELIDGQLYDMAPPSRMHQKFKNILDNIKKYEKPAPVPQGQLP